MLNREIEENIRSHNTQLAERTNNKSHKIHFLKAPNTGDCCVFQLRNGESILMDTHTLDNKDYVISYIENLGINKFDYVILTHYHNDHVGNFPYLTNFFDTDTKFILPQDIDITKVPQNVKDNYNTVNTIIDNLGATKKKPTEKEKIELDNETYLYFLNTNHNSYYSSSNFDYNNCCLCFYFYCNNYNAFFSSDVGLEAQGYLKTVIKKCNIYKAHHHSADKFLNYEYMRYLEPELCITMDSNTTYKDLINDGYLHNWLQSINIPNYPTSRNGDIIINFNGDGYKFLTTSKAYTTQQNLIKFLDNNHVKRTFYNDWTDISESYTTLSLESIINLMENGTTIQQTISYGLTMTPSFISDFGGFIQINKNKDYAQIILTDRNKDRDSIYIGTHYKGENVKFKKYVASSKTKYRTIGIAYPKNVETLGSIIEDYTLNNNGKFSLESGKIKVNYTSEYEIGVTITADCKYDNSEIIANVYKNNVLLFAVTCKSLINSNTYGYYSFITNCSKNDIIEVRFKPMTNGANSINISSTISIEEV
jgi:competence protein ComEC